MWLHWQTYDTVLDLHQLHLVVHKQPYATGNAWDLFCMLLFIIMRLFYWDSDERAAWLQYFEMSYKKRRRRSGKISNMLERVACSHPLLLTANIKLSNHLKSQAGILAQRGTFTRQLVNERIQQKDCNTNTWLQFSTGKYLLILFCQVYLLYVRSCRPLQCSVSNCWNRWRQLASSIMRWTLPPPTATG